MVILGMIGSNENSNDEKWKIFTTKRFERSLIKLNKEIVIKILQAVHILFNNPFIGKKLTGILRGKRSLRVGDYRVIYHLNKEEKAVYLLDVRHRKVAYKRP